MRRCELNSAKDVLPWRGIRVRSSESLLGCVFVGSTYVLSKDHFVFKCPPWAQGWMTRALIVICFSLWHIFPSILLHKENRIKAYFVQHCSREQRDINFLKIVHHNEVWKINVISRFWIKHSAQVVLQKRELGGGAYFLCQSLSPSPVTNVLTIKLEFLNSPPPPPNSGDWLCHPLATITPFF